MKFRAKYYLRILFIITLIFSLGIIASETIQFEDNTVNAATSTDPNFKVAFIGDSGAGGNFQNVLNLIKNEGAGMVLHQGDFDYSGGPSKWMDMVDNTLGSNFPYFGSDGNHDNWDSDGYSRYFTDRIRSLGLSVTPDPGSGTISSSYSITYKGLKMVFSKENGDPTFIDNQLSSDNHTWKVCSWHKNMTYMQIGGKGNAQGWPDYENCRKYGAIIATGHEHTYERTKTLTSMQNIIVDTNQHPKDGNGVPQNSNSVLIAPGKTFVFVSGLGGVSIRNQDRCFPSTYPYGGGTGCNYIWASIYTSDQGAKYGALFITFNVNGNPNKAHAYFKNISGQIIDEFDISATSTPTTPGPSKTPNPSSVTPTTSPSPTPGLQEAFPNGVPHSIPGKIEAENFDKGGAETAYSDSDAGNNGAFNYRQGEDVDISSTSDSGGGYHVGWTEANEWLEYTADVQTSGTYTFQARVVNNASGGKFRMEMDGSNKTGSITVPNTNTWTNWQTIEKEVNLSQGQHVMRIYYETASTGGAYDVGDYNWFNFIKGSGSTNTPSPTISGIPGDANGDDQVDIEDYFVWINNYNLTRSGPFNGDFNNSSFVDGVDYTIWLKNYSP